MSVEFVLFALVLIGVALFHHHTLRMALAGAVVIALYKIVFSPFKTGAGLTGFGVALSNMYPQAKSVGQWVRHGWHVALAYVIGFFVMLAIIGFHPGSTPRKSAATTPAPAASR